MKKIFFAILIAAVVNGNAVANVKTIDNPLVTQSFEKEFSGAQSVKWEVLVGKEIYHAFFIYNNEALNSYFNEEGTLLATGRYLKFESLPMLTAKNIKEKYNQYTVLETIEFGSASETSYIVKLESEKLKLYIQAYSNGSISVLKKEKKNLDVKL